MANKVETLTIRLDTLTRERLSYISDKEYRPMASQIRKVVEDFVNSYAIEHYLIPQYDTDGNLRSGDINYPMPKQECPF